MGDKTGIEWTDATWNPIVGCSVTSPGCTNCYAMQMAGRLDRMGVAHYAGLTQPSKAGPVWTGVLRQAPEATLLQPLRWRRPRRIFVNSMSDLFHENVPDDWIDLVFAVMALAPQHTFQVLTKRAERMRSYIETKRRNAPEWILVTAGERVLLPYEGGWPTNVWLGVSVEDQVRADERIPHLLATPAAKRLLSCEPLLGPVDLTNLGGVGSAKSYGAHGFTSLRGLCDRPAVDWVIVGGESGPRARPMHPDWARSLRDQCQTASVPFFFKQWGEWAPHKPVAGGDLGGDVRRGTVRIMHPTGQTDCEVAEETGGRNTIPGSRYMARLGKHSAGALLDGREWREMPA